MFLFTAASLPFISSLAFFLFSFQGLDTEDVGQRLDARPLQTSSLSCALPLVIHNITGALVSMHPFLPYPGIPILPHTLSVLLRFFFFPNNNGTISLKLMMLINSYQLRITILMLLSPPSTSPPHLLLS